MVLRRVVQAVQVFTIGVAALFGVLLFVASPPPPPALPVAAPGSTIDVLAVGEQLYDGQCESCHGSWGEGVYAPVTIDRAASVAKFPDPSAQEAVVAAGQGQMPSFRDRLSPEQIAAVVAYVRTLE